MVSPDIELVLHAMTSDDNKTMGIALEVSFYLHIDLDVKTVFQAIDSTFLNGGGTRVIEVIEVIDGILSILEKVPAETGDPSETEPQPWARHMAVPSMTPAQIIRSEALPT